MKKVFELQTSVTVNEVLISILCLWMYLKLFHSQQLRNNGKERRKKIDRPTLVTPGPLLYILPQEVFRVKRPQLGIKSKIEPITSYSVGWDSCSSQSPRVVVDKLDQVEFELFIWDFILFNQFPDKNVLPLIFLSWWHFLNKAFKAEIDQGDL